MSYQVIKMQRLCFLLSLETENMEFSDPSSQPSLSDSKWSPAFNLVPLQMSGRQRASSVTAIDQALFSTAAPMDGASQGPCTARQSHTSQLALGSSLQRMPLLSAAYDLCAHHYNDMTNEGRAGSCGALRGSCSKCQSTGADDAI